MKENLKLFLVLIIVVLSCGVVGIGFIEIMGLVYSYIEISENCKVISK